MHILGKGQELGHEALSMTMLQCLLMWYDVAVIATEALCTPCSHTDSNCTLLQTHCKLWKKLETSWSVLKPESSLGEMKRGAAQVPNCVPLYDINIPNADCLEIGLSCLWKECSLRALYVREWKRLALVVMGTSCCFCVQQNLYWGVPAFPYASSSLLLCQWEGQFCWIQNGHRTVCETGASVHANSTRQLHTPTYTTLTQSLLKKHMKCIIWQFKEIRCFLENLRIPCWSSRRRRRVFSNFKNIEAKPSKKLDKSWQITFPVKFKSWNCLTRKFFRWPHAMALDNFGATNTCWHLLKPGRLVPTSRAIDHSWTSATAQRWAKLLQVLQASQLRRKCHYTISIQKSKGNCQQNLCQHLCQLIANRSNRSQIASNRSKRVWVVRSSRHSDSPWRASRSAGPLEVFWRAWQPSILISCQKRAQISLFLLHLKSANLWTSLNCRFCADFFSMFLQFLLRMPTQPTQPRAAELTHFLSTLRHRGALHISGLCSTAYHCGVRVQFRAVPHA